MPTISSKYTYHIDAGNLPVLPTHSISQWLLASLDKSVSIVACQWASKYRVPFLAGSRLFYFSFLQNVKTNYRGQEWVELYLWLHGVHRNISIFHHSDYQICYFTLHKTCKSNAEILIYETIINHGVYWNVKKPFILLNVSVLIHSKAQCIHTYAQAYTLIYTCSMHICNGQEATLHSPIMWICGCTPCAMYNIPWDILCTCRNWPCCHTQPSNFTLYYSTQCAHTEPHVKQVGVQRLLEQPARTKILNKMALT